ncbi:MAG: cache domain-containing protein [Syntrophobacteraceae bacterium]
MPRSKTDAKTWVEKAAEFYRNSGKRIALAEFTRPDGAFVEDEIYLYVLNSRGTMLAHGINERFVGEEFMGIQDSNGRFFIREIVDTANKEGSGWVEYKWFHPITKKWLPKIVYFEKVDDLIICAGIYDHSNG